MSHFDLARTKNIEIMTKVAFADITTFISIFFLSKSLVWNHIIELINYEPCLIRLWCQT
jgi:hypothetical protein